jgi:isopenicillin N synthase-like dioxygenase
MVDGQVSTAVGTSPPPRTWSSAPAHEVVTVAKRRTRFDGVMDVPVVDLAPWTDDPTGDTAGRSSVAAGLDAAFTEVGFAVVVGHGLDQELVRDLRSGALDFFTADDASKRPWRVAELGDPGWVPIGLEANGYVFGEDTPPDLKETFVVARGSSNGGSAPAFAPLAAAHLEAASLVYEQLMEAGALALGLDDPELLVGPCRDAPNSLSINWYPSVERVGPPLPGQYRIGPHTDFGTLTLLDRQPGLGCLQVQLADGRWVDAPHVPGALIVNVADLLALWSAGRWRSARHRVLPPDAGAPGEQLLSLVCFCEAQPDALIAPLPGTPDDRRFEPVVAGEHLAEKLRQITVTPG